MKAGQPSIWPTPIRCFRAVPIPSVSSAPSLRALQLTQTPASSRTFSGLSFWLNGGTTGGQVLTVTGTLDGADQTLYTLPALLPNTWQAFTITLSNLGVADQPDFDGIWIWNNNAATIPTFYVDDITLLAGSGTTRGCCHRSHTTGNPSQSTAAGLLMAL